MRPSSSEKVPARTQDQMAPPIRNQVLSSSLEMTLSAALILSAFGGGRRSLGSDDTPLPASSLMASSRQSGTTKMSEGLATLPVAPPIACINQGGASAT